MVAENILKPSDFIAPLFIVEGSNVEEAISSMPGYYRRSIDGTIKEVKELWSLGIKSVLLFIKCADELKDNKGTEAVNPDGLMQRSIRAIKNALPEMVVMTGTSGEQDGSEPAQRSLDRTDSNPSRPASPSRGPHRSRHETSAPPCDGALVDVRH